MEDIHHRHLEFFLSQSRYLLSPFTDIQLLMSNICNTTEYNTIRLEVWLMTPSLPSLENLIWSDRALADIFLQFIELKCLQQAVVSLLLWSVGQSFVELKIAIFPCGPALIDEMIYFEKNLVYNRLEPNFPSLQN